MSQSKSGSGIQGMLAAIVIPATLVIAYIISHFLTCSYSLVPCIIATGMYNFSSFLEINFVIFDRKNLTTSYFKKFIINFKSQSGHYCSIQITIIHFSNQSIFL